MRKLILPLALTLALISTGCVPAKKTTAKLSPQMPWDKTEIFSVPKTYPGPQRFKQDGLHTIFYSGLEYEGKPTRIFACYGLPETKPGQKVPAVVLAHGGGGTAFAEWVSLWNQRGYAAIAMDWGGQLPAPRIEGKRQTHQWSGPLHVGIFSDIAKPLDQQWMYHAVADVVLAHSFIRSLPQVDPDRVGLVGISWGGIISSIVVGVDHRFAFAVPIYGCGFLYNSNNHYQRAYETMPPLQSRLCQKYWDGSSWLKKAKMPIYWIVGIDDSHFLPPMVTSSYELTDDHATLCFKPDIRHSHPAGWQLTEPCIFADHITKNTPPLIKITAEGTAKDTIWAAYNNTAPTQAELIYTYDDTPWPQRKWLRRDATIDIENKLIIAQRPAAVTAAYIYARDNNGFSASSKVLSPMQ